MKKIKSLLIAFSVIAITVTASYGQTDNPLRVGVKGGINLANLRTDEVDDNNMKVGLNLGLFAKLPVSNAFSIQPEILYSSKGSKLTYDNFVMGEGEYRFNLNYLEMPVLGVIHIGKNFNIHAGPYVAFLASSNIKDMNDDGTIEDIKDLDADKFNRFDYGIAGGIGADIGGFIFGARYNYGLKEVGNSDNITGDLMGDAKNSAATLYIGYGF